MIFKQFWLTLCLFNSLCEATSNLNESNSGENESLIRGEIYQHSIEVFLHSSERFWNYIDIPIIVFLGGHCSGKTTLVDNVLKSSLDKKVLNIPGLPEISRIMDMAIQQTSCPLWTYPKTMQSYLEAFDLSVWERSTRDILQKKFPNKDVSTLLQKYENDDFYYDYLVKYIYGQSGIIDAVLTTHTHSYEAYIRLKKLLAFNFIKAPVYAFYTFVNIDELLQRGKKRNFEVLKKTIPFYEIRFYWDIFSGFLENLTTEKKNNSFVITLKKSELCSLLDKEDSTYFPYLMRELKKTFHITGEFNFETERQQMTKKIDEIFSHENQVDFFFKGIDVHMGMVDETTIAVLRILDKCF